MMLPLDILIDIGRHGADAFDYNTVLNLSLTCRTVHSNLKSILEEVVMWTEEKRSGFSFYELVGSTDVVPEAWKRVKYGHVIFCKKAVLTCFSHFVFCL